MISKTFIYIGYAGVIIFYLNDMVIAGLILLAICILMSILNTFLSYPRDLLLELQQDLREEVGPKDQNGYHITKHYYKSGRLAYEEYFKNDMPHGLSKGYYENGTLKWEGNFEDSYPRIERHYYPNGKLKEEWVYKYGTWDSTVRHYTQNGDLKYEEIRENDNRKIRYSSIFERFSHKKEI